MLLQNYKESIKHLRNALISTLKICGWTCASDFIQFSIYNLSLKSNIDISLKFCEHLEASSSAVKKFTIHPLVYQFMIEKTTERQQFLLELFPDNLKDIKFFTSKDYIKHNLFSLPVEKTCMLVSDSE